MLQTNAKTDYGLLVMLALTQHGEDGPVSLRMIADEHRLPYRFLTQIIIPLRQGGLVEAKEGLHGGYQLSRPAETITVADVVRVLEGDIALVRCLHGGSCRRKGHCALPNFWQKIGERLTEALSAITLAELAKSRLTLPAVSR